MVAHIRKQVEIRHNKGSGDEPRSGEFVVSIISSFSGRWYFLLLAASQKRRSFLHGVSRQLLIKLTPISVQSSQQNSPHSAPLTDASSEQTGCG